MLQRWRNISFVLHKHITCRLPYRCLDTLAGPHKHRRFSSLFKTPIYIFGSWLQEYIPSVWETDWRLHALEYSNKVCETMKKDTDRVEHWMTMAERYNKTGPSHTTLATFNATTFPKFVYRCSTSTDQQAVFSI